MGDRSIELPYIVVQVMSPINLLLVCTCLAGAIWDLRTRRIPNWITVPALIAALVLHSYRGALMQSLIGFVVSLCLGIPLFALRGLGAGDVKLTAAVGAIVGWPAFVVVFVLHALLGGAAAIGLLVWKGDLKRGLRNVAYILGELISFRAPYHGKEELDVASPRAITLPQAPILAVAAIVYVVFV